MADEADSSHTNGSTPIVKSKRYAVIVGVNDYAEASIGDLAFCTADAEAFYDALLTYAEYDPSCVRCVQISSKPLHIWSAVRRGMTQSSSILQVMARARARIAIC